MRLTSFQKFAVVSAVALGAGFYAVSSNAAVIQISDPVTIDVTATVENTITVNTTDLAFGQIGSLKDGTGTSTTATMLVETTGVVTDEPGDGYYSASPASIVYDTNTGGAAAATVAVTGAFFNENLYVDYDNFVDPINGAETFTLLEVHDDLATVGSYNSVTLARTTGIDTTDGAGALSWNIGGTIQTEVDAGAVPVDYTDGLYTGSFDVRIVY